MPSSEREKEREKQAGVVAPPERRGAKKNVANLIDFDQSFWFVHSVPEFSLRSDSSRSEEKYRSLIGTFFLNNNSEEEEARPGALFFLPFLSSFFFLFYSIRPVDSQSGAK